MKKSFREIYKGFGLNEYEISAETDFVTEVLTGLKAKDIILGKELTQEQQKEIESVLLERVRTGRPIQQIVKAAYFAGDRFYVDENTLIPRPETEFLVNVCKQRYSRGDKLRILDIGTGSGCISIELAKYFSNSEIDAVDICQQTLDAASKNVDEYGLSDRIHIYKSDIYSSISGKFDIIVSNPPYIPYCDIGNIQRDVYEYEPHIALFAEEGGLYFYVKIIEEANIYLKDGGFIVFETGINQADIVWKILERNKFRRIGTERDFNNIDRVIYGNYFAKV